MVANIARGASVLALLLASACGGGGDGSTSSSGSGGSGGSGGGVEVTYPFGFFQLDSSVVDSFASTLVEGAFQVKANPGCEITTVDGCQLADCRKATGATLESGGKLTVTGGDAPITLTESKSHVYSFMSDSTSWAAGAKLTLKAAGADVPAFSVSGVAPSVVTVSKPSFDGPVAVNRSQDLELAWSGASDDVRVLLVLLPDKSVELACTLAGAPGKGTIPTAILGKIPVSPSDQWEMVIQAANKTVTKDGDWTVELVVTAFGATPQGASSGGEVVVD